MNTNKDIINNIFLLLAAFTLTNAPLLAFFESSGQIALSQDLSFRSLMLTTLGAGLILFRSRISWVPVILTSLVLFLCVLYEQRVDFFGTVSEYSSPFLIHGLGGLIIGYAISNYQQFIRYLTYFSLVYAIVFFMEPVNHLLLGKSEMVTGYTMIGIIINLILACFTVFYKNKIILYLALASSLILIIFTSRGCGLGLLGAWAVIYFWDKKRKSVLIKKSLIKTILICGAAFFVLSFGIDYVNRFGLSMDEGSLAEKIASGSADSSNGRDELWEAGYAMIRSSWLTGMGFGADREGPVGFFVHNIFIELGIDFGIIVSIVLLFLYWSVIIKGIRVNYLSFSTAIIIAQVFKTWVQLLFSSSYLYSMLGLMFIVGIGARTIVDASSKKTIIRVV